MEADQVVAHWEAEEKSVRARLLVADTAPQDQIAGRTGMEVFEAIFAGELPPPPIGDTLDFVPIHMEPGIAVLELLGTLLKGRRESFVLATKYTQGAQPNAGRLVTGNSRKAMVASVEASLKRLGTDRIDLYWVHWPDSVTPIEEIVRGFEDLARAGKILYAGLSNFPAWRLSRAVTLAELTHSVPIAAAQFEHSLVHREPEADLFPASHALGLGIVTWSPLGGGMLTGKYRKGEKGRAEGLGGKVFQAENSEQRTQVLDTVIAIANELGVSPGQVAIAWSGTHGSLPIVGPRSVEQLADNLAALSVELSAEQIHRLDTVSSLSPSMPARTATPWARAAAQVVA